MQNNFLVRICLAVALFLSSASSVFSATAPDMTGIVKETYDYAVKDGDTLRLDVYYNPDLPFEGKRPVIIFSFGGGWEAGARADGAGSYTPFLNTMTRYGYIGVGIDYRLGYLDARKKGKVEDISICSPLIAGTVDRNIYDCAHDAIMNAVEDLFDATTFVVNNAERWNADDKRVIISGISAGGINSLTAENLLVNKDPLAVDHLPEGFSYAGVVSGCGAIWHDYDQPLHWDNQPCPIMFIHGNSDPIVPFARVVNEADNFNIEGSRVIADEFKTKGWPYMLVIGEGKIHAYGGEAFAYDHELINRFIRNYVLNKIPKSVEIVETSLQK